MKIGVIDVDTSHPPNWIPLERELGHEVVGLWDGGTVHPRDFVEKFAAEHEVPTIFGSLDEMAEKVDCAVIHSCNWDTHVDKARPFIEAGKAVLIDKPLAGNLADLNQLRKWSADGARITGGSTLRFCQQTLDWLDLPEAERGRPDTVFCGCAVDEYNYAIHAYATLAGLMGSGAVRVRHLGEGIQRRIQIDWADGRMGLLAIGETDKWMKYHVTVVTNAGVTQLIPKAKDLYRSSMKLMLDYLDGKGEMPATFDELTEPAMWALAARRSWLEGDRFVELSELDESDPGYDGKAFGEVYRLQKYPAKG